MRMGTERGFTLLELLIVIAIIGILAGVLIPSLLNARARAFDTATISCLKQLATKQEAFRAGFPFIYDDTLDPGTLLACQSIVFTEQEVGASTFTYTGYHRAGRSLYTVGTGTSVVVLLLGGVP